MAAYSKVLVPSTIERGGFGNERTYRVRTADGDEHIGIALWTYCYNEKKQQVEDEPEIGQEIPGFVIAKLIKNGGNQAKVEFPDGGICNVAATDIQPEPLSRVLIQS